MKTPFPLLGASLLFWGWQTGLWPFALIMALALEGSRLIGTRLDFSPSDFNRISDICTLIFIGMFVYLYASEGGARTILTLISWMPLALLPLALAQIYGARDGIDIRALFLVFRRKAASPGYARPRILNLTYPYFALCILSASAANERTPWFFAGLFILSAWALWPCRSRRFSAPTWAGLLVLIGLAGYGGQMGLYRVQGALEKKTLEWFMAFMAEEKDPFRARTAIGDMGTVKLSDRILFRVQTDRVPEKALLLREAVYNAYQGSIWFAMRSRFKPVTPGADGTTWVIGPGAGEERSLTVSTPLRRGKGLLKLPSGTRLIEGLPVLKLVTNQYGCFRVEEGPGFVSYTVRYEGAATRKEAPAVSDFLILPGEKPFLDRMVHDMGLDAESPKNALQILLSYFQRHFSYSLVLERPEGPSPIRDFLLRTRSGHCEYFATATVLLLRAAGIPARYATGYAVDEFSNLEKRYVVRARHAHAWAMAYVDGAWHDLDTTPADWMHREAEAASSLFQPFQDLVSWLSFRFTRWRWSETDGNWTDDLAWVLIPLILFLVFRLSRRGRLRRPHAEGREISEVKPWPGKDSQFYRIEQALIEQGHERRPWETLSDWILRLETSSHIRLDIDALRAILTLHYRYRFDPAGINEEERRAFKERVEAWLKHASNTP